jgi:hypothetical protein
MASPSHVADKITLEIKGNALIVIAVCRFTGTETAATITGCQGHPFETQCRPNT